MQSRGIGLSGDRWRVLLAAAFLAATVSAARAQDLEPRAYANTPVGLNFVIAGYGYSEGGVVTDPFPSRTRRCRSTGRRRVHPVARREPLRGAGALARGVPRIPPGSHRGGERPGVGAARPVRCAQAPEHRNEPLGGEARGRRLEGARALHAGVPAGSDLLHRQPRLRRQDTCPGPDLLGPGTSDLQLPGRALGRGRRHVLRRRTHDRRRGETTGRTTRASAAPSRCLSTATTRSSSTPVRVSRPAPARASIRSASPGSIAGAEGSSRAWTRPRVQGPLRTPSRASGYAA